MGYGTPREHRLTPIEDLNNFDLRTKYSDQDGMPMRAHPRQSSSTRSLSMPARRCDVQALTASIVEVAVERRVILLQVGRAPAPEPAVVLPSGVTRE
jgi:hypothetical protein